MRNYAQRRKTSVRLLFVLLIAITLPQLAFADDEEDDGDEVLVVAPERALIPGAEIDDLFQIMGRLNDPEEHCPQNSAPALFAPPLPSDGLLGCVRLINSGDRPGIWRIDFEQVFGGDVRVDVRRFGQSETVLENSLNAPFEKRIGSGRWLASLPISIASGESVELRVALGSASDMADADPVLRPESDYVAMTSERTLGFGGFFGASLLLLIFFAFFARLLQSVPARRYTFYFAATVLAVASAEGFVASLLPGLTALGSGALDLLLEIAQVVFHLSFIAAFLSAALPGYLLTRSLPVLTFCTGGLLVAAAVLSFALGGLDGALAYHDLGYELDPLFEGNTLGIPLILGALATLLWIVVLSAASILLLRARSSGARLFALGAGLLILGLLLVSFGEDLLPGLGDDHFALPYVFLLDAVLFAAAIVRQTFGLRDQRDAAIRQELAATQEKMRLADTLLHARRDTARARALAEKRRAQLALTGHDLRQPLTSLRMALSEARELNPSLGETLSSSLEYLAAVLEETRSDTWPDVSGDLGSETNVIAPEVEAVPLQVVLSNVGRMFAEEASAKGLILEINPTDLVAQAEPIALIRMTANLVSNAVKYTKTGRVLVAAKPSGDFATLEVSDTGPGLAPEEAEAIRQDYQRGASSAGVDGEGIGLSSVQALARKWDLTLRIDSTPGHGSCFAIDGLPLASG
ncbi:MAG: HAMP domain-containing sensor histidine kinase [Pseudomonadota bacterium]